MDLAGSARLEFHPVAEFLLSEIRRAEITDNPSWQEGVVTLNRWVVYQIDSGPTESRVLVHPEEYVAPERQLSVLSPVGAALIGIKVGDRMPFVALGGTLHIVTAISVDREQKIMSFARRSRTSRSEPENDPFDPGPAAA
ncbi:MAG: GreA/GreB family elongation factor [Hyphomicrobiales bacterium]|nr:GreA/GreB family elongation factor [Hyphomicrobiales bacterium]